MPWSPFSRATDPWKARASTSKTTPRPTSAAIAGWAFALALPLVLAGIGIVRLIEADYVVTRQEARAEAAAVVERLGRDVGGAATAQTDAFLDRLLSVRQEDDPVVAARSLVYASTASAALLLHDGQPVFPPPDGWDMPVIFANRVGALHAAASLQPPAQPAGWYAGPDGPVFFACHTRGTTKACVSIDWTHIAPTIRTALAASAAPLRSGDGP